MDKRVVFGTGTFGPHHIVKQQLVNISRGKARQLQPRSVDDDLPQFADLGTHAESHVTPA
jgi:hypothetical protein